MSDSRLQQWFPWTISPVIANGPMLNAACAHLATEVTKAGGLGFVASVFDINEDSAQLARLDADLTEARQRLDDASSSSSSSSSCASSSTDPLRVGASFLTFHKSITKFSTTALPIIKKHRPAAVWLFAPDEALKPHRAIIPALKALDTPPIVLVQVGNVAAAREAVQDGAGVLVCQGIDAGGHQFRRGMGVVTLVLEVRRMLDEEFAEREVCVFAAGGIVDGKGVAAVMTLEADGVIMGTRFTVAEESIYPDFRKQLVLQSVDGGSSTLKSPFNDQINENTLWDPLYDGRAIIGPIHEKFLAGASLDDCLRSLKNDHSPEQAVKMINTWAGTGVGLVRKAQPAGEIVREARKEAKQAIQKAASRV